MQMFFFFQAEDGIRDVAVTGVQTCALPIYLISGGDAATTPALTTIVSLDPIYFYFDMSEGDYLAYQRATAAGMLNEARETTRSEERRVGKECRCGGGGEQYKEKDIAVRIHV